MLHLRRQGHQVTIITTAAKATMDQAKNMQIIRVAATQKPQGVWEYYKILRKMKRAARALPPHDIVISMTDPPLQAMIGDHIARRMQATHIHWAMDLYPDLLPVLGKQISPFLMNLAQNRVQRALKRADYIVPISACMERYLTRQAIPKQKMHRIENWPDHYMKEDIESAQPLLDDSKFRVLYAGTIGLAHEFDTVISTAIYFQKTDPDIEFLFTARGRGFPILERKVKQAKLRNIRFLPPQPSKKLSALMQSGDLHLVTMKKSAVGKLFPSKFYTACAAARPVLFIGPSSCDIHQKITQYQCGATIRNGESRLLINAITHYKNNAEDWFAACNGAADLLKNHDPLSQWTELIERV